jgi:hypothetical protein
MLYKFHDYIKIRYRAKCKYTRMIALTGATTVIYCRKMVLTLPLGGNHNKENFYFWHEKTFQNRFFSKVSFKICVWVP